MAATYQRAGDDVLEQLREVMIAHHGTLADVGLLIDVVLAHSKLDDDGNPTGPALKHHGIPAAAVVKVNKLKDRVLGRGDAEIILDGDKWDEIDFEEKAAILDHELTHLVVVRDKAGDVAVDDLRRPKLKLRPHTWEFGWFDDVAHRHGAASLEVQQATMIAARSGQLYFSFAKTQPEIETSLGSAAVKTAKRATAAERAAKRGVDRIAKSMARGTTATITLPTGESATIHGEGTR